MLPPQSISARPRGTTVPGTRQAGPGILSLALGPSRAAGSRPGGALQYLPGASFKSVGEGEPMTPQHSPRGESWAASCPEPQSWTQRS